MSDRRWWRKVTDSVKRSPAQSEWLSICTQMTVWFEEERLRFFSNIIKRIDSLGRGAEPIKIPFVRQTLRGKAELALKGFQLFIAVGDIEQNAYIARSNGRNFTSLLFAQVGGIHLEDTFRYADSYKEVVNDSSMVICRLISDVVRDITNDNIEAVCYCYMLLNHDVTLLMIMTKIAIASAFDDKKSAERLAETGAKFLEKISGEKGN